jgi:hypothetical protein
MVSSFDNSSQEFLQTITTLLDESHIEFMVTGSFVSSYYGDPRTTRDLDFVVNASEPPDGEMHRFVEGCIALGFYVSVSAALDELHTDRRQFNVISSSTGWKADIMWVKKRLFSESEFARRRKINLIGVEVFVPSPEDLILAKLEWGSNQQSRQFDDARSILRVMRSSLDFDYLHRWAQELELTELLDAAVSS